MMVPEVQATPSQDPEQGLTPVQELREGGLLRSCLMYARAYPWEGGLGGG